MELTEARKSLVADIKAASKHLNNLLAAAAGEGLKVEAYSWTKRYVNRTDEAVLEIKVSLPL